MMADSTFKGFRSGKLENNKAINDGEQNKSEIESG